MWSDTYIILSFPIKYNLTIYLPFGLYIGTPSFYGYILFDSDLLVKQSLISLSLICYNYDAIQRELDGNVSLQIKSLNLISDVIFGFSSNTSSAYFLLPFLFFY